MTKATNYKEFCKIYFFPNTIFFTEINLCYIFLLSEFKQVNAMNTVTLITYILIFKMFANKHDKNNSYRKISAL